MSAATNRKEATLPETVYLNSLSLDMHSGCGTGTYKNNILNSWEGMYLSAVNFSTSNEVVPEPATATLGLFGLVTPPPINFITMPSFKEERGEIPPFFLFSARETN